MPLIVHMKGLAAWEGRARQVKASRDKPLKSKLERISAPRSSHDVGNSLWFRGGCQSAMTMKHGASCMGGRRMLRL